MDSARQAICILVPEKGQTATGVVKFLQEHSYGTTKILGEFKNLTPGKHGFHVHSYGNLLHGCTSAGAHFNPLHLPHGGQHHKIRHVGDLGNVEATDDGTATLELNDP